MKTFIRRLKCSSTRQKILFCLSLLFFLLYFTLGLTFVLCKNLPFAMSPAAKMSFGILLIAYSVFRLARIVRQPKKAAA